MGRYAPGARAGRPEERLREKQANALKLELVALKEQVEKLRVQASEGKADVARLRQELADRQAERKHLQQQARDAANARLAVEAAGMPKRLRRIWAEVER